MLALVYLAVMMVLGAYICRRFYRFTSLPHRLAASFLVGLVLSTWATYLFALPFAWSDRPLLGGNILFFTFAGLAIYKLRRQSPLELAHSRSPGSAKWDAVFICALFLVACCLMFGTISLSGGKVRLASVVWNDFGPNLSLVQSFAIGHNFPTEYPHFIGEPIRYHFLFWFQAGNLEFLGLSMAWALNLLSVLSLLAMLILIMTLGELLFNSRAVGRIAASLFFFPSTLSYVSFLRSQGSLSRALGAVSNLNHWLASGYPYKGEDWGAWSLSIFYVQRHFLGGISILLLVLIFLVDFFQRKSGAREFTPTSEPGGMAKVSEAASSSVEAQNTGEGICNLPMEARMRARERLPRELKSFIFCGFLLGLLPLWNSPAFAAAFALVTGVLFLFPHRIYTFCLLITAAAVGVPQLVFVFLRGQSFVQHNPIIHWGLVVENPTLSRVLAYFCFTFGPKFLLGLFAVWLLSAFHRRLFAVLLILPILAFTTQLSTDIINNHKFLYIWLIIINLFVASILWRVGKAGLAGKAAAVVLALVVTLGGIIEWFRIHNDSIVEVPFNQNPLSDWLQASTKPTDVFLTERFVIHPILLNGRRIFYGWPYFAWSMGYPTSARDTLYKQMLTAKSPSELVHLLNDNGISYVGIDNDLRQGQFKSELNEEVYKRYFKKAFEDKENRYGSLTIYEVPACICEGTGTADSQ
jgi:hypothetical protein